MVYSAGGAAAAAAAAAARRRLEAEEEEMTPYTREDVANDWEFKIVRANSEVFGNPAKLKKLQEEESRAGWVMVEKFDNHRVRFKRPLSARSNDSQLAPGIDPYRVHYGLSPTRFGLLVVILILGLTIGFLALLSHMLR